MGPLAGYTIIEVASIGPGPFCAMMLADMGANVIRVDRAVPAATGIPDSAPDLLKRGRRSIAVDLKHPSGIEVLFRLAARADGLIEGFRPGVMEGLGIGPEPLLSHNPRLVYGRMTGWGQDGPWSSMAGHDIDYIAVTGVLGAIGRRGETPVPPLNLVGDFGGGGMLLAFGMVCGLLETARSGRGQVIDAAMVDGSAVLSTMMWSMAQLGLWNLAENASNLLDGTAPFYDTYRTADGLFMAVGAIEPQFYAELLKGLDLDAEDLPAQLDPSGWPQVRAAFEERFAQKPQDEWTQIFNGTDACVAPVLMFADAPSHPHLAARGTYVNLDGVIQPGPAPRFSRTRPAQPSPGSPPGGDTNEVLLEFGFDQETVDALREQGAVG